MTNPPCGHSTAEGCVTTDPVGRQLLDGRTLLDVLDQAEALLAGIRQQLDTQTLATRSLLPAQYETLPDLLQTLIDRTEPTTPTLQPSLLDQPIQVAGGCLSPTGTTQFTSLRSLLPILITTVCSLKADVTALKAGATPTSPLYLP